MSRYTTILVVFLVISLPFFFYKLGQTSLVSWDEAWYADISRNILKSWNPLVLTFNGQQYVDHPPFGFWLTAISQATFGMSDFSARAGSAVAGFACLFVVYILGKHLFHSSVGLASTIALLSSPWFISRARSGNLDIYLTLFFLLTYYFAATKRYIPFFISLTLAFLTKSGTPFTLLPACFLLLWPISTKLIRPALKLFVLPLLIWFLSQQFTYPYNFVARYFQIGLPHVSASSNLIANIQLTKANLHHGIGDWFRPAIVLLSISVFLRKKNLFILLVLISSFVTPFFFSPSGQIWHLVPIHPFVLLGFFGTLYSLVRSPALILTVCLVIAVPLLHRNWVTFIDIPAFISDEAILATKSQSYPGTLIIDEDYIPAAVYYSKKHVELESVPSLHELFARPSLLLITHDWRLVRDGIDPSQYTIIATDRDKVLLIKN